MAPFLLRWSEFCLNFENIDFSSSIISLHRPIIQLIHKYVYEIKHALITVLCTHYLLQGMIAYLNRRLIIMHDWNVCKADCRTETCSFDFLVCFVLWR